MPLATLQDVAATIHRRICPLYTLDDARRIVLIGSAIPFRTGKLKFLLTAAHVFGEKGGKALPIFTIGTDLPLALTGQRIGYGYEPKLTIDPDVALIGLSNTEFGEIDARYQVTTPADTANVETTDALTVFMLAGYPQTRNRVVMSREINMRATPTYVITPALVPIPSSTLTPKHPKQHFALAARPSRMRTFTGGRTTLPKPVGMSGGGVWRLRVDRTSALVETPLLVGIIIEHLRHDEVFIAARVQLGIPLAYELVQQITKGEELHHR